MYGIIEALLWAVKIAYGVWVVLAFGISRALFKNYAACAALFLGLLLAPPGYFWLLSHSLNRGLNELREENESLLSDAQSYLTRVCEKERQVIVKRQVAFDAGVRLDVDHQQTLALDGTPSPLPETPQMRRNQERYGQSHPRALHKNQYIEPIYWVRNIFPDSVLIASRFEFVEAISPYQSPRALRATARKRWWLSTGRSQTPATLLSNFDRRLSDAQDGQNWWLSWPIVDSTAKYALTIEDISTLEDRRHWVARGRIRLVDRATRDVVIEYVGFAANKSPAYEPRHSYPWQHSLACPGLERRYDRERGAWDVLGFFFHEVVQYE
ncbi:hypothetical protein [Methyloversatilis sp.]|uniref:hypothetical protein n=1 Tax=Methyloversatilis sp. TaxID=2569862 RepID=UPI003D2DD24B